MPLDPSSRPKGRMNLLFLLLGAFLVFQLLAEMGRFSGSREVLPYSQFLKDLDAGRIASVTLGTDILEGVYKESPVSAPTAPAANKVSPRYFTVARVEDPRLIEKLTTSGVQFTGVREGGAWFRSLLSWIIPFMLLFLLWSFILRRTAGSMSQGGSFMSLGKSKAKIYVEKDLKTRFTDVAGVDEAKTELSEIVNFLKEPQRYSLLGGRMPKGILLVGPPGTGKTLLARAVAGEAHVPFFSINGSEFVEMFVGLGAARVRDLFEEARKHTPCIIFIDELDALGKARGLNVVSGGTNEEKEQTLNQLLAEMDGFDPAQGVILLAATNRPEILDPALLRAGRFDRSILVDKPDRLGRVQILQVHAKKIKKSESVSVESIASMTSGFSGADLSNLVNEAALIATRREAESVEMRDFTEAIERIVAGLERKNRLLSPNEKKRVAYHEMGHAVVALALGHDEVIHKVSIIPRGISALGFTMSRPLEDRYLMQKDELEAKMAIALGGRASELQFFSQVSTGAGDDLDKATDIARVMVTRYGMSDQLGTGVFESDSASMLGKYVPARRFDYSEKTAELIDLEVRRLLDRSLDRAMEVVRQSRSMIEEAVSVLLVKETLDENSLKELWNKHGPEQEPRAA